MLSSIEHENVLYPRTLVVNPDESCFSSFVQEGYSIIYEHGKLVNMIIPDQEHLSSLFSIEQKPIGHASVF